MSVALHRRGLRRVRLAALALGLAPLLGAPAFAAEKLVAFSNTTTSLRPGTIVIRARERALYFVLDSARAIRYPIAVPKYGKEWSGAATVNGKFSNPDWAPPPVVKHDHPELPDLIRGGSPSNPMGVAALTLDRDQIAIHGTTRKMRQSIGTAASYGCIRMLNEDVSDLFQRVSVGTPVVMVQ
jgi:lipoprotein-anchoring transpeptidase ErfK/SrfK